MSIQLPVNPLKVDGIFGRRTFAAVYLFQEEEGLPPTGEIDALTLDRLEPLIPSNPILGALMNWVMGDDDNLLDARSIKRWAAIYMTAIIVLLSILLFIGAHVVANFPELIRRLVFAESDSNWLNILIQQGLFFRLAQIAPALTIFLSAGIFPAPDAQNAEPFPYIHVFQNWHVALSRIGLAYCALVGMSVAKSFVDAISYVYTRDLPKDNPIGGIARAIKRGITIVGLLLIVSAIVGKTPTYLLGGMGAALAITMLVFKDTIRGLVASAQILSNQLVKIGDWIDMPDYGASGDVMAITLTCVKVQNFDKTISTIPTYALLSQSFKNWRGIKEAGGRRIKRAIYIDMDSIQVCTAAMVKRFLGIEAIADYIQAKQSDVESWNEEHDTAASPVNSRRLTNIGTFRAYLEYYLSGHKDLSEELTCLVRQLPPSEVGLPIEIYAFTKTTDWKEHEAIQADIFDHIISVLPEFGLRTFQDPTSLASSPTTAKPRSPSRKS